MSELLDTAQEWIVAHKELVTAVLIPLVTAIVTAIATAIIARANLESNREDRVLQKELQKNEERREEIAKLRSLLSQFEALANSLGFDLKYGLTSGSAGKIPKERANEGVFQLIKLTTELHFLNFQDTEWDDLNAAMWSEITSIGQGTPAKGEAGMRFAAIGKRILERQINETPH